MIETYMKIELVIKRAGHPLAPHEFESVKMESKPVDNGNGVFGTYRTVGGREYVGCSESALGRRMREMRALGRLTSKRRDGTAYVEYDLAPVKAQELPPCPV